MNIGEKIAKIIDYNERIFPNSRNGYKSAHEILNISELKNLLELEDKIQEIVDRTGEEYQESIKILMKQFKEAK